MEVTLKCSVDDDTLKKHYEINKDKKVPWISKLKNSARKRKDKVLICAGGPTIREFHPLIQDWKGDIFASKTVEYLENIGVAPHYCIHVDAGDNEPNRVWKNKKTNYLFSTQIKPEVFDVAKGCKVFKFNTISSNVWMPPNVIAGGSNSTAQALFLCAWLGYKEIHITGFDCGFKEDTDGTMILNVNRNNINKNDHPKLFVTDHARNLKFQTDAEYLGMAQEATKIIQILSRDKKIKFHAYGNSVFTTTVDAGVKKGSFSLGSNVPLKWLKAA